jgi:hypothetical protein
MDLYFNPYPGAAANESEGLAAVLKTADALRKLKKTLRSQPFQGVLSSDYADRTPANFIVIREKGTGAWYDVAFLRQNLKPMERERIAFMLNVFSKGRVLDPTEVERVEGWIASCIETVAPVLEMAARNQTMALTIGTESEWCVDKITFKERDEFAHNLWGQEDVSVLAAHCIEAIENSVDRFAVMYHAVYCGDALKSAPNPSEWEQSGLFRKMREAAIRKYRVDDIVLKKVGNTDYGALLELRPIRSGVRMFFSVLEDDTVLVGGFYQKGDGSKQNDSIDKAVKRINNSAR